MSWFKRISALALIALMSVAIFAADQAITGTVKDSSGAVIPGVNVTLTNSDTGQNRSMLSNETGGYLFTNIRTGNYELRAELEGFSAFKMTGIKVEIGDKLVFPIEMKVSGVGDKIDVVAQMQQVETTTSNLSQVIDEKRIVDLPLNGRSPLSLVFLTPGVTTGAYGYASANGSRERGNNYQLDGVDNNDTAVVGSVVDVNVDATAEFRVTTSNPSAEYGRAGGAVIDVITKSGTNQYKGNVFWFVRNQMFDAQAWDQNTAGVTEKAPYKRNQFGGSFGGPIVKDKLFFFANTQIEKVRTSSLLTGWTPTAAFRDSVTNPAIKDLFNKYYPLPNGVGVGTPDDPTNAGNYGWVIPDASNNEQYTGKIDWAHSEAHNLSFRYFRNRADWIASYQNFPTSKSGGLDGKSLTQSLAADWTWIINPNLVNNVKLGLNRVKAVWTRMDPIGGMDLNFGDPFGTYDNTTHFDAFGYGGNGGQFRYTGTTEIKDTLTWNIKNHSVKFGLDIRHIYQNGCANFGLVPRISFAPDDGTFGGETNGDTIDNIRMGQAVLNSQTVYGNGNEFIAGFGDYRGWRTREYDFFVQDDWKVLSNLTLNLGLRYEAKPAPFEVNNLLGNFDSSKLTTNGYRLPNNDNFFDRANWVGGVVGGTPIWTGTGTTVHIVDKDNGSLYNTPKKNFAPRVGFSWDPFKDGKMAIRGGYGISYDRIFDNLLTWTASAYPFALSNVIPAVSSSMSGIYPSGVAYYGRGIPMPPPSGQLAPESFVDNLVCFNEDWKQPYIQTWNASVQREVFAGHILNVTWAGSAGVHLLGRTNPNQMHNPSASYIQTLAANGITASIPAALNYYQVQNSQFRRLMVIDNFAHSNYNALQLAFSRRFSAGLQYQINYTWAKAFDNSSEAVTTQGGSGAMPSNYWNLGQDRGFSSFDVRHSMNASVIYELPFGPGKWIGGNTEGFLAKLIGGWQVNAIIQANAGYPLDYKCTRDTIGSTQTGTRAPARPFVTSWDFTREANRVGPTLANFRYSAAYINVANPNGDYYRGFFRGPNYWNMDFSLFKEIGFPWFTKEGAKLQLRAEAFNLFNHTNYGLPGISFSSPANFGMTYTAGANRRIQFGVKILF